MTTPRPMPILLLAVLAALFACSEELPPPPPDRPSIEPAVFTRVLSDLVVARIDLLPDTTAFERRTAEILERNGVSAEDLRGFVQAHGQNDDLMTGIYARVSARLDSLYPVTRPGGMNVEAGLDSLMGTTGGNAP